jgi:hypothetical protein
MSQSGSGKLDPVLEALELLFKQKGGSASFGTKVVLSLNGVGRSCMNSITGSTCRAKCSNILHDKCLQSAQVKKYNRTKVALNKSSSLLKILFQNKLKLRSFTINNKQKLFTKVIKNAKEPGLG